MSARRNFHEGEATIQAESGVDSDSFDEMVEQGFRPEMNDSEMRFVGERTFAVAGSLDGDGRPWGSPLVAAPHELFEVLGPTTIRISAPHVTGDPLWRNVAENDEMGVLFIDPAKRRRAKSLGHGSVDDRGRITYTPTRFYGLCARYIYKRSQHPPVGGAAPAVHDVRVGAALNANDRAQLEAADTVFLVSHHSGHGTDPTHRGGPPGFVRVLDDQTLALPDYPGNGMFQTLGNVLLDNRIGLLSVDFVSGRSVSLTGRGSIRPSPQDDVYSARTLYVAIDEVRTSWPAIGEWSDIQAFDLQPDLFNPATPFLSRPLLRRRQQP